MCARVTAIANRKGGVGKTASAVNLAAEFAARGRRVLVVDLDTQGHAALGLGGSAAAGGRYAQDALRGALVFGRDDVRPTAVSGVDLLPADPDYAASRGGRDPHALARALRALAFRYDDTFIDVAPAIDEAMVAALAACDRVLIPTLLHPLAADGVAKFAKALFQVVVAVNRGLSDIAILPTQVDLRLNMHRAVLLKFVQDFGAARVMGGIRADTAVAEAFGAGLPVRSYRPRSRGAADYAAAAERLMGLSEVAPRRLIA